MNLPLAFNKSEFTPAELAALSGRSVATIHRKIKAGEIDSHRRGSRRLIDARELTKLLPPASMADA